MNDFIRVINTLYIGNFNKRFHLFNEFFSFFDETLVIDGYKT